METVTWIEIEPQRRKAVKTVMPLPPAYTHYTVVDGVTIYRCKTKLKVDRGIFGHATISPPAEHGLNYGVHHCVDQPIRPSDEAIALHDKLVDGGAL